jgi:hypothetical protein
MTIAINSSIVEALIEILYIGSMLGLAIILLKIVAGLGRFTSKSLEFFMNFLWFD